MLSKERWLAIIFAAVVSEAVPYRQIWYSSKFQSVLEWEVRELPTSHLLVYLYAFFPVLEALVLLVAFGAYLGAMRSLNLRGFLKGLLAAVLLFAITFSAVIPLLTFVMPLLLILLPRLFFYYVVWRLPLFISLVVGIFVARKASTSKSRSLDAHSA